MPRLTMCKSCGKMCNTMLLIEVKDSDVLQDKIVDIARGVYIADYKKCLKTFWKRYVISESKFDIKKIDIRL